MLNNRGGQGRCQVSAGKEAGAGAEAEGWIRVNWNHVAKSDDVLCTTRLPPSPELYAAFQEWGREPKKAAWLCPAVIYFASK